MEVWKDIKNYEGIYQVSNKGQVRSLNRKEKCNLNDKFFIRKGKILNQTPNTNGYLRVFLSKNNKVITRYVHRLVAQTFLKQTSDKNHVNHLNGIKEDNSVSNLEWCTQLENNKHGFSTGLLKHGAQSNLSVLNKKEVFEIIDLSKEGHKIKNIAKKYGVHPCTITRILRGKSWYRETGIINKG